MYRLILYPIIAILVLSCCAADFYVDSEKGNDSWSGTQQKPWKSLSKVNSTNFNPGDKVLFKCGSIFYETLVIPSSGDYNNDLYIGSYGSGNAPVITAADPVSFYTGNPSENILSNSSFEKDFSFWKIEGDVDRIVDPRYGQYAAKLSVNSIPSIQQDFHLQNGQYILSIHHHEEEIEGHYDAELVVYLRHNTNPPRYWNNGWSGIKSPTIKCHKPEWDVESVIFPSDVGSESYSVTVTVDKAEKHEHLYVDGCFVVPLSQVYESYIAEKPDLLFLTRKNEVIQLYNDDGSFPSYFCWVWSNGILRVSLPYMPDAIIEASIRKHNIDFNSKSHITIEGIRCEKAYGAGINMSYGMVNRPTGLSVKNCQISHSGTCGILSGYRPEIPGPGMGLTPSYISIENCNIFAYARNGVIRYQKNGEPWYKGTPVTSAGISVTKGEWYDSGVNVGSVVITNNTINGNLALINYSTGRNGISINMGNEVLISHNNLTQTDHAISITGSFGTYNAGDVQHFEICHNECHVNGDDGIWIYGMGTTGNKIHHNDIHHTMDNGIDLMSCTNLIEIYKNSIRRCTNEAICIWGHVLGCADIHHNTFSRWGDTWKSGNPGKLRGCAIGIGQGLNPYYSHIDYNIYQQDHDAATAKYPFSVFDTQYSWKLWRSEGFDQHSKLKYLYLIKH